MFSTALRTPLPLYLFGSLSRSSKASLDPVLAPDGTDENALILLSSVMFTPTVGFPLESKISLATIDLIFPIAYLNLNLFLQVSYFVLLKFVLYL